MRTTHTRRARLLTGGAAFAMSLALAGVAHAQSADQDPEVTEVDEIVVTGIRASIENSIATKRDETSIVEVVTAEDIGKLPDVSIAESLGRLPGLALQRLDGRGQNISIRGLGPDFTTALLNGREQVSTGDNRGVEFDQYPSELLGSVVVYKTPDAALTGQGLAGTADLRVVRPLEYGRRALAANVRYERNDIGALNAGTTDDGNRFSISYIDQFADDTIGVVLGYAHIESPYQSERFNAWGYPEVTAGGPRVIGGSKPYVMSSELERDGWIGVLEYRPNDQLHMTFDAFYSQFDNTQILRGIELPLFWSSATLQPGYTVEDGLVTAGTYTGVKGVVRNDVNTRDSELLSVGWNLEQQISDNWSFSADLSFSSVERTDVILETYAGTGRGPLGATDTIGFETGDDITRFSPGLDYGDFNLIRLTSPQGWGGDIIPGGQDGYLNNPSITDDLTSLRTSVKGDVDVMGFIDGVEVGLHVSRREKEFINDQFFLGVPGGASAVVPEQFRLAPTSLAYLGIPRMISYDALGLVNSGFYNQVRNPNADVAAGNWRVTESVTTPFVKFDVDTTLFGLPTRGNFGVQFVHTDQESQGFASRQLGTGVSATQAVEGGDDYWEILPSTNLIFELAEGRVVRFAAARTLARARMDEMRASRTFNYNAALDDPAAPGAGTPAYDPQNPPFTGSGGNPELRPWIANVIDVSFEQYFGRQAYFSVAVFYKDLESYIYNQTLPFDYTGYAPTTAVYRQGTVSTPENGTGGEIYGIEAAVSMPFDMFHPSLEGFGGNFSISQTESNIETSPGSSNPIPGLSETVANVTIYYEKDGFQARASNRYRSEFLGEVAGFGNGRTFRQVGAESIIDAQIGYEFQSGPLEGLSALFQVNNLTDEPFYTYEAGDERRVIDHQTYGRTFLIGLNYRY